MTKTPEVKVTSVSALMYVDIQTSMPVPFEGNPRKTATDVQLQAALASGPVDRDALLAFADFMADGEPVIVTLTKVRG